MENCKYLATSLNDIVALNLSGAIDKGQWGKSCDGESCHAMLTLSHSENNTF